MNDTVHPRRDKAMNILAEATGGRSYKAHKYGLDNSDRPSIDYGDNEIVWKRKAETIQHRTYIDLTSRAKALAARYDQVLTCFLDGSRRVFKVDDMAFPQSGGEVSSFPLSLGKSVSDVAIVSTDALSPSSLSVKSFCPCRMWRMLTVNMGSGQRLQRSLANARR